MRKFLREVDVEKFFQLESILGNMHEKSFNSAIKACLDYSQILQTGLLQTQDVMKKKEKENKKVVGNQNKKIEN